jgi:hypothetical protein
MALACDARHLGHDFALPVGEEEEWRMSRRFLVHKQPSRIYSKGDGI